MAQATFHSFRGEKSALVLIKANAFVFQATPVYVPADAVQGMEKGDRFEIPDGYQLVPIVDIETGEVRTSKDGSTLYMLGY